MTITLKCPAFADGKAIPKQFTGDGEDVSPTLTWENVPAGTVEFALVCDDPDAPSSEPWVHWLIYKIPGDVCQLPQGVPTTAQLKSPTGTVQGRNSWPGGRTIGYRGPAPPKGHGVHHYHFRLYALDTKLSVDDSLDVHVLRKAMSGHILAQGELIGTYER